jgi:hypothetical protein
VIRGGEEPHRNRGCRGASTQLGCDGGASCGLDLVTIVSFQGVRRAPTGVHSRGSESAPPFGRGAMPCQGRLREGHKNSDHARDLPIHESVLVRTTHGRRGLDHVETLRGHLFGPHSRAGHSDLAPGAGSAYYHMEARPPKLSGERSGLHDHQPDRPERGLVLPRGGTQWGAIIQFAALSCRFLVSPLCRLVRGGTPPSGPFPGS